MCRCQDVLIGLSFRPFAVYSPICSSMMSFSIYPIVLYIFYISADAIMAFPYVRPYFLSHHRYFLVSIAGTKGGRNRKKIGRRKEMENEEMGRNCDLAYYCV